MGTKAMRFVVPSMRTRWALSAARAFTTMTRSVANATGWRHRLRRAARSRNARRARLRGQPSDPEASPSRAPAGLRLPWRHDRGHCRGYVDRSAAPGRVDSRGHVARSNDPRRGVDADALLQSAAGALLAELLRRERLSAPPRVDPP